MLQRSDTLAADAVFYVPDDDWYLRADCPRCKGYALGLRVRDPHKRLLAEVRASAFLEGVHSLRCLGCEARARRRGDWPLDRDVWWDPIGSQWMAPADASGGSLPLGIRSYWARQEARAAARALREAGPLPLRVAAEPAEVDPDSYTVFYDAPTGRWLLHAACFDCGGFDLALRTRGRGGVEGATSEALRCLDRLAEEGCPHCRTELERDGLVPDSEEPRLWFDTRAGDWVVWRPLGGPGNGVTLPLDVGAYDADDGQLLRRASELLFGRPWLDLGGAA